MKKLSCFLGVDQTGAAIANGKKAKPLKVCLIKQQERHWHGYTEYNGKPLTLEGFTPSAFKNLLSKLEIDCPLAEIVIVADCVLGMPHSLWPQKGKSEGARNLWRLFQQTSSHEVKGAIYGRNVSEIFFSRFFNGSETPPKRHCEKLSGSNSLFTTRPFQKNIQTGSYRIWRDLTAETNQPWLNIWPFNTLDNYSRNLPWLFEGYPSLLWKNIFGLPQRKNNLLIEQLNSRPLQRVFRFSDFRHLKLDADLCDATVLAISGVLLQDKKKLFTPFPNFWKLPHLQTEGWICGLGNE